jgi:DNA-binding transcriptional LysR family regulator
MSGDLHFTLRQLEYFVAVAETGSISSAAALCHVSQPGLSLALGQLEESLGVTLFVRSRSKGTALTPSGVTLVDLARSLLTRASELQVEAERESGGLVGRLHVGCYTTLAPSMIPSMLTGFGRHYPDVALDFIERPQPELQDLLRDGTIELALLYEHQLGADLDHVLVESFYPYLLLPKNHRLADEAVVSLFDVADEPMIMFDVPPSRENSERIFARVPLEPIVVHQTQNFELVRCLVGRGLGIALLFQRPHIDLTYEGYEVVCRPIKEDLPTSDVVLAFPTGVHMSARASLLLQYVTSEFACTSTVPGGDVELLADS